jgi:hypothetical protein
MSGNFVQNTTSEVNHKFLENVRHHRPHFFGNINSVKDFSYIDWIKLIEGHPLKGGGEKTKQLKVYKPKNNAIELRHLERRGSMPQWFKDLHNRMSTTFKKNHVTAIAFGSFGPDAKSFKIHRDRMDVVYLQVVGSVKLSLWKPNVPVSPVHNTLVTIEDTFDPETEMEKVDKFYERIFYPDQLLWIPRGTYHYIEPLETRLGISFGIEGSIDPSTYI